MVAVRVQPFWQQKHPTPTQRGWDFHRHPAELPALARGAERAPAGAALCLFAPDALVWARTFSAYVPSEQRHYVGLAGVVAQPAQTIAAERWAQVVPSVLGELRLPAAEPWADDPAEPRELRAPPLAFAPAEGVDARLVQAVVEGGTVGAADPQDAAAPRRVGRILSWLPPASITAARTLVLAPLDRAPPAAAPSPELKNLYHYLTCALGAEEGGFPAAAWRLVLDLARARKLELPALFRELTRVANAWDAAPSLRRYLLDSGALAPAEVARCDARAPAPLFAEDVRDAGWLWNRVVHYWGRGLLGEPDLVERLANVLSSRIVVDHLYRLDHPEAVDMPWRHLRRLHFEALLGHPARARLLATLAARLPQLGPQRGDP